MPWIEETLRHDRFLDDLFHKVFRRFKDKKDNYWWQDFNTKVKKVDVYKITFEKGLLVKDENGYRLPSIPQEGMICITRHIILRRWDNEYLAFAQSTGAFKISTIDLPTDKGALMKRFVEIYKAFLNYTTVYSYTLDSYDGYTHAQTSDGKATPITILCDDNGEGVLKASLDIEFYSENEYYEDMKQSPIMTMNLKADTGDMIGSIGKLNYRTNTNWWADSLIQLCGVFDETSCFFTLKVDSAPTWEDNNVTLVPFFFGNLVMKDSTKRNEGPIALLGGTQVGKFFDFDSIDEKVETLQPITRNYVHHPSNGVDSIMLKKTKYGARYQAHYLKWNVPSNFMPPTREEIRLVKDAIGTEKEEEFARKYPRAWNYLRFGYYQYDFHPSRYSEKVHASRAHVIHPEDGSVGYIPNIVLLPTINVMEGDNLRFPYWCETCDEEPYHPEIPEDIPEDEWTPFPPGTGDNDGNPDEEKPYTPPSPDRFSYHCDYSIDANTVNDDYWEMTELAQQFMIQHPEGLGRRLSKGFWEGRNDWIELIIDGSNFKIERSKVIIEDFHQFLWMSLQEVQSGKENVQDTWGQFKKWCDTELNCLTDLQKASLFMTTKLMKPVLFHPSSEDFLQGDILDKMASFIKMIPNVVYDWIDFNDVEDDSDSGGITGAWALDLNQLVELQDGSKENIFKALSSIVNFEPQLLWYTITSANAHRPHDYMKPSIGFGSRVIGGEYTEYYKPEFNEENYMPYVAAEKAIHELGHSVSYYGFDKFGSILHDMPEWLDISGWKKKSNGQYIELTKSKPGTTLDNGKLAPVSDYGCFQPSEDFAEAFTMYVMNRRYLREKFKAKHDFIYKQLEALGFTNLL